ncbi:MAG TPA: Nif3-like dinuclear metal center hexameric protein, partial [Candidatus Brevibacterium intestinigallinarum]|nr:Nif3-like dinuclear metal center hexameric protein [Candidatus Brevibacterium intestinigallinarum]
MTSPTLAQVRALIDDLWPESYAVSWDSVGLTVGDPTAPISSILLAVDPMDTVIAEAEETSADLLLTHHPLLLRGVTTIAADTLKGGQVTRLVRAGIAHLAAHTNADSQLGGVSDALLDVLDARVEGTLYPTPGAPEGVGVGRVGTVEPTTVRQIAKRLA